MRLMSDDVSKILGELKLPTAADCDHTKKKLPKTRLHEVIHEDCMHDIEALAAIR